MDIDPTNFSAAQQRALFDLLILATVLAVWPRQRTFEAVPDASGSPPERRPRQ
jgi:hypothetical protein